MAEILYDVTKGEPIFIGEYLTFDLYFAAIASMRYHPGAGTKEHTRLTLEEWKDEAVEMLKLRRALPVFQPLPIKEEINE